jgi:hypothetical protein
VIPIAHTSMELRLLSQPYAFNPFLWRSSLHVPARASPDVRAQPYLV